MNEQRTLYYFVKREHENFWFSVERGVWVKRREATRFLAQSMAHDVAKMLRRQVSHYRIYVSRVIERPLPRERLRFAATRAVKAWWEVQRDRDTPLTHEHWKEHTESMFALRALVTGAAPSPSKEPTGLRPEFC